MKRSWRRILRAKRGVLPKWREVALLLARIQQGMKNLARPEIQ